MSDDQDTRPESGRPGPASTICAVLFGLLLAYPLSVGPVAKLCQGSVLPKNTLYIYDPLDLWTTYLPPARMLWMWYLYELWGYKP